MLNTILTKNPLFCVDLKQELRSRPRLDPEICSVKEIRVVGQMNISLLTDLSLSLAPAVPNTLESVKSPYKSPDQWHWSKTRRAFPSGSGDNNCSAEIMSRAAVSRN